MLDPHREAGRILAERRFHATPLPHPLRQPLHDLGTAVEHLINRLSVSLPGGRAAAWVLLAAVVAAAVVLLVLAGRAVARRRGPGESGAAGGA